MYIQEPFLWHHTSADFDEWPFEFHRHQPKDVAVVTKKRINMLSKIFWASYGHQRVKYKPKRFYSILDPKLNK